jgi:nicotinamide-nucleotide adenylyltransferase
MDPAPNKKHPKGIVHGRFQVFHNDHLTYLLAGANRCEQLIVGITNPDPSLTRADDADPHRSSAEANPLTFEERQTMIAAVLSEQQVALDRTRIVPFPVNFPELYGDYVPLDATFFLTICDPWGERKRELFESMHLNIEILWRRPLSEKGITSTDVRRRIAQGQPWHHLVPRTVATYVESIDLAGRLTR